MPPKPKAKAKAPKKSVAKKATVAESWKELFEANEEKAAAPRKKPLNDDQLVAAMEKKHPDKVGKTTLTRVSMCRGCYNKGTNMFAKFGPAKQRSYKYVDGERVEPNKKKPASAKKAKAKPAATKAKAKPKAKAKAKPRAKKK